MIFCHWTDTLDFLLYDQLYFFVVTSFFCFILTIFSFFTIFTFKSDCFLFSFLFDSATVSWVEYRDGEWISKSISMMEMLDVF